MSGRLANGLKLGGKSKTHGHWSLFILAFGISYISREQHVSYDER